MVATAQRAPLHEPATPLAALGEHRFVLSGVSWATYEALLADHADRSAPRFAYDRGLLEIMSPLPVHERRNWLLAKVVEIVAEETGVDFLNLGSTTFRREDLERGFEPDSCFYVHREPAMRGKAEIDLRSDPPPDLVIEIDITHPSLEKLPLYARLGVPEVWRDDGTRIQILVRRADSDGYDRTETSPAFAILTVEALDRWLGEGLARSSRDWIAALRAWVRERVGEGTSIPGA